ncbi:unnamed protein product, partial [Phaeothamnion confervicola]
QAANIDLRGRLRRLEANSDWAELFARYEADVAVANAELTGLRERNLRLELRL